MKGDIIKQLKGLKLGIELEVLTGTEESTAAATSIENVESTQCTQEEFKKFDKMMDESEYLADLHTAIESFQASGVQLSQIESVAIRACALRMSTYSTGLTGTSMGAETFNKPDFLNLAREDLKERYNQAKEGITKILKMIWEKIVGLFRKKAPAVKRLDAHIKDLISRVTDSNWEEGKVIQISNPNLFDSTSNTSISDILHIVNDNEDRALRDLANLNNAYLKNAQDHEKTLEDIKAIAKICTDTITVERDSRAMNRNERTKTEERINDAWSMRNHTLMGDTQDVLVPVLKKTPIKTKSEITLPSKSEMLHLLTRAKQSLEAEYKNEADLVLRSIEKAGATKGNDDQNLIGGVNRFVAQFAMQRSELRMDIVGAIVELTEKGLKESGAENGEEQEDGIAPLVKKYVEKKDVKGTRAVLTNMAYDNSMTTDQIRENFKYASDAFGDLNMPFKVDTFNEEISDNPNDWDERYYHEANLGLQTNFNFKRLDNLLKVRDKLKEEGNPKFKFIEATKKKH